MKKNIAMVACQFQACAEKFSFPLDMVRVWNGEPICEECYEELEEVDGGPTWFSLPCITLKDLRE